MSAQHEAVTRIREWRENPVKFVHDVFGVEPDLWQADALESIGAGELTPRRRLAMKAATGVGKSGVLAWIGWHRLVCFADKGEHPKGAALSGEGWDNLQDNLWAEIAKWQSRSEFLSRAFVWNRERVYAKDHAETWFLSARSYPMSADAEAVGRSLSGLHSKFPFILLDETGDMPVTVGQKAEQIFTGGVSDALVAQAGNPTSNSGLLYHVCVNERERWDVITITAAPDDPKRSPRVDIEHAREQIKVFGLSNPWVKATILGEFPDVGINTLLSVNEVEAAMSRGLSLEDYENAQKRLGVDCARFGSDFSCIFPRQGLRAFKPVLMSGARSNEISARVALAKSKWGSEMEFIDGTGGYGSGVVDGLIQAGHSPQEINFAGKADDPRYFNKRSEMWFRMAEWVKRGGCMPKEPRLVKELTAPTYSFQGGKFRLEEKEQIKKRLGFSTDLADALALTFAIVEMPRSVHEMVGPRPSRQETKHEWDPYC